MSVKKRMCRVCEEEKRTTKATKPYVCGACLNRLLSNTPRLKASIDYYIEQINEIEKRKWYKIGHFLGLI